MKEVLRGWFKGPGNAAYEAGRFLWFISVLAGIGYAGWKLALTKEFSIVEFGIGMGSLLAAGGWGVGAKDKASASAVSTTTPFPEGGQP